MSEDRHFKRLIAGCLWVIGGMWLALIFEGAGYSVAISIGLGMVGLPVVLLCIYVIGAIAIWASEKINSMGLIGQ